MFERNLRHYFELPAEVEQECAVADLADHDAGHVGNSGGDLLGVRGIGGVAGDVDDHAVGVTLHDIQRSHGAFDRRHRPSQGSGGAGTDRGGHADRDRVSGAGVRHLVLLVGS